MARGAPVALPRWEPAARPCGRISKLRGVCECVRVYAYSSAIAFAAALPASMPASRPRRKETASVSLFTRPS
eukprot:3950961-Heterocapsa_arctica.AAC.1